MRATGPKCQRKSRYRMAENEPIRMFCGLPVIVAVLPMFDAVATASRYGTGLTPIRRVAFNANGTMTRQMMSLTKNAESSPLRKITVGKR